MSDLTSDTLKTFAGMVQVPAVVPGTRATFTPPGWNRHQHEATEFVSALSVRSLSGVAAYLNENRDKLDLSTLICVVDAIDQEVEVSGPLEGEDKQFRRQVYITANPMPVAFNYGAYFDCETMIVGLQTCFVQTPERDSLVSMLSSIRENSVRSSDDDGLAQEVSTSRGIVVQNRTTVPNPALLRPYRTYHDIEQPVSPFLVRLKSVEGEAKPQVMIREADGGAWRAVAVASIVDYLKKNTSGVAVIG